MDTPHAKRVAGQLHIVSAEVTNSDDPALQWSNDEGAFVYVIALDEDSDEAATRALDHRGLTVDGSYFFDKSWWNLTQSRPL